MIIVFLGIITMILVIIQFSNTGSLLLEPLTSPDKFLSTMPYTQVSIFGRVLVLIQPSSTFFVYALGVVMIVVGIYFLVTRGMQWSRFYWAVGLILWGISAIVAGTSYQAFGYELKCRGQEYCLFTSDFELVYMLLTAYCINILVTATGYTSLGPTGRKSLILFSIIDSLAYSVYLLIGAVLPVRFLISYEGFMAFIGVNFIIMFILNIRHYLRNKDPLNRNLIVIWIGFLIVNIGYFVFLLWGFGAKLYQKFGMWFTENDVLHILLILWTFLIFFLLRKNAVDTLNKKQ
jgi:hypothetical protein